MFASLHQFRRAPGYSLAFVASLAIGIAAACTSFAVVKRAFLDPLPYPEPDRLLTIQTVMDGRESLGSSYQFGEELRGNNSVFADVSADWGRTVTFEAPGASERVPGGAVTANYFSVVGWQPALGTTITPGAIDEVVVSWPFFQRALGGDPAAVGTSIVLDGMAYRVVGVMPAGFVGPYLTEAQLWVPLNIEPFRPERARGDRGVILQARLADGVTLSDARAFLTAFGDRQRTQYPAAFARQSWVVAPLRDVLVEPSRTLLIGTAAATALLMLIVLVNIAGLSAARATEVRRADAVRLALGAGQARLFGERLSESVALGVVGAAAGLWLAALFINWVVGFQQQFQLFLEDVPAASFDWPVAGIGVLLGVSAAAVGALVPQRAMASVTAEELLGTARGFGHAKTSRTRGVLVVVQVAVAVVLIFSAGLLVRTMQRIDAAPLGFDTDGLGQFSITLPATRYGTAARVRQFETAVIDRLRAVNGVAAASATFRMPTLGGPALIVTMPGRPEPEGARAVAFVVAPGFFEFLRVPLRDGREFAATDTGDTPPVVVISESMARTFWPEGRALGARFRLGDGAGAREVTVVGIVGDVRQDGPALEARPTVYESTQQRNSLTRGFVFRASRPLSVVAGDVRAAILAADTLLATSRIEALDARIDSQVVQQRFVRSLLTLFAVIAAGLCALGLFAVVSLTAHARRHEFAMRMALGARSRQVAWLVVRQALLLGVAGSAAGLLAASWLIDALRAMLTDVSVFDPITLIATALALLALAVLAAAPPAIGATRIDPVKVLKSN